MGTWCSATIPPRAALTDPPTAQPYTVMCTWFLWFAESPPRSAIGRQPSLSRCTFQIRWFQITYWMPSCLALARVQAAMSSPSALPPAEGMVSLAHVQGQMRASSLATLTQLVSQAPHRLLAGAQHHGVDPERDLLDLLDLLWRLGRQSEADAAYTRAAALAPTDAERQFLARGGRGSRQ